MDITLCLTHDCNMACSYCYAGKKHPAAMPEATMHAALNFAFSQPAGKIQLSFFGGEPLLEWDLLQRSTMRAEQLASKKRIELLKTLTTNATLLTEERAEWLQQHHFLPAVSIDGNRAMHESTRPLRSGDSSFDATLRGLKIALRFFQTLEVIVVVDPANISHFADSIRFLVDDVGVCKIGANPNFNTEWPEEALALWTAEFERAGDFYLERFRANRPFELNFIDTKIITRLKNGYSACDRCGFGESEIAVAPSGNLYPCERLVGDDRNHAMCIGTVFAGFDTPRCQTLLQQRGNTNPECAECAIQQRCMNWCGCINHATTGKIDATGGTVCFHERLAIDVADRVAGTLYEESNPAFLHTFYR